MSAGVGLAPTSACNVFDRELPELRAPLDAGGALDGGGDVLGCNLSSPFGTPVFVDGVASTAEDASLRLSPDEKTAYFFSARSGNQLLYSARRDSAISPFVDVMVLANVNTGNQYNPTITADGLTLFFASFRATGVGDNDIFQATRGSPTGDFSNVRLAPNVNTTASEVQPYVTHDGTTMYFNRKVATRATVFRAMGSIAGGFTNPSAVPEIVGPTNDTDPVLSADGLTLFWASDRLGGQGDLDIWTAHRTSVSGAFESLAPVTSVNSTALEAPSDVSENGCRLYLTSRRSGRTAIYVATRGT